MTIPILSIVGKSGSGKTTLLEKLIAELKRRGYRVATIKHHAHPGFEIDQPGKDTWRHAQAGSDHVVIAAPDKIASIRRLEHELTLDEIAATIIDVDIILTDGFKRAGKPALEVARAENGMDLVSERDKLVAVATDGQLAVAVPQFGLDDIARIVDWVVMKFGIALMAMLAMTWLAACAAPPSPTAQIPNPASQHCETQGGELRIETRPDGGQYGVCVFEDNYQCEEWAMMRGDCPVGGVKVTGYITDAGRFCAISGGEYAVTGNSGAENEEGTCTFTNGKVCEAAAFYNGTCSQ